MSNPNPIQQQKIRELVLQNGPVGVYQLVLDGTLNKFPFGFWSMPENYDYARACTQYFFEELLCWNREQMCQQTDSVIFKKYKLSGMLHKVFYDSWFSAIENAYPGEFKPWEFRATPRNFWDEETAADAIRWLYTEKYPCDRQFVIDTLSSKFLNDNGLCTLNNYKLYDLLDLAFPGEFKPWELKYVPKGYWSVETATQVLHWLYTEKYPWDRQFVIDTYSVDFLRENGLRSATRLSTSLYDLLNSAFPGEFKPWELNCVPNNYWTEETVAETIRWLYTEKYPWDRQFVLNTYSAQFLREEGLGTIFHYFPIFKALDLAFPGEFNPSEFKRQILQLQLNHNSNSIH